MDFNGYMEVWEIAVDNIYLASMLLHTIRKYLEAMLFNNIRKEET